MFANKVSEFISSKILIKFREILRFGANLLNKMLRVAVARNMAFAIGSNNGPVALFFALLFSRK